MMFWLNLLPPFKSIFVFLIEYPWEFMIFFWIFNSVWDRFWVLGDVAMMGLLFEWRKVFPCPQSSFLFPFSLQSSLFAYKDAREAHLFDDFCVLFVKLKCIVWVLMMLSLIAIWWCYLWCWNFENLECNWKMNVLITFGKSIKNLSKCEVTWLKCEETKANAVS